MATRKPKYKTPKFGIFKGQKGIAKADRKDPSQCYLHLESGAILHIAKHLLKDYP